MFYVLLARRQNISIAHSPLVSEMTGSGVYAAWMASKNKLDEKRLEVHLPPNQIRALPALLRLNLAALLLHKLWQDLTSFLRLAASTINQH